MLPKRFGVKYFAQGDIAFDLAALVPVFQRWIQQHSVEGLLIDVADYKHVHQGPGVILIGHEGDYGFDLRGGRPGLLYTRKREIQGTLVDNLQLALRLASDACRKLAAEPTLNGLRFSEDRVEIFFLDRLAVPNTPEAFVGLRPLVAALYPPETAQIESVEPDPRKPLTIRLTRLHEIGVR
jgi:hypothetical protein